MPTLWFDPTSLVTGEPALRISYPNLAHTGTVVGATAAGDDRWVSLGTTLPLPARVESVVVCYQVNSLATPPSSRIEQVRLRVTRAPDQSTVLFDVTTPLASKTPVCTSLAAGQTVPDGALELELRLDFGDPKDQIVLTAAGIALTDLAACGNRRGLGEFGDYRDSDPTRAIAKAQAALDQALKVMVADGGGVLCIPRDAPAGFVPRNHRQPQTGELAGVDAPAVTVIDARQGFERLFLPPIGTRGTSGTGRGSRILERDLDVDLDWQDVFSTELIQSRYRGGASSYLQYLSQAVAGGSAVKSFYLPTLRGIFRGQRLRVTTTPRGYDEGEVVTVAGLGVDANGAFFTARSTLAHPAQAIVYNKNMINGLTVEDVSNCDNQSQSLTVERTVYGLGDSFGIVGQVTYQGDILSAGGDEGSIGIAAQLEHDLDCFWGFVDTWDARTGELIYQADAPATGTKRTRNPQKLGTSRPLINMNSSKWITAGTVQVLLEGVGTPGRIVGDSHVTWDSSVVGRFFTVDDKSEYYLAGEANALTGPTGRDVRRWWRIGEFAVQDGVKTLYLDRAVSLFVPHRVPTLFQYGNYGKPLPYIIAPGAWVSDVRQAVAGDNPVRPGWALDTDPRKIVLAPSSPGGDDFAPGDPISNAVGPDPLQPTGFRARHFDSFPSAGAGYSFLSENYGRVQLGAALAVLGPAADPVTHQPDTHQKDSLFAFGAAIDIIAATDVAIKFEGEVNQSVDKQSAIDFYQPNNNRHRIRWFVPGGYSALHAAPDTGTFMFEGGALDFGQRSSLHQQGLSATETAAKNLRGIGVAVPASAASLAVKFGAGLQEENADYALLLQCSWPTASTVTKGADGFVAAFSPPAPAAGGKIDWLLVR